MDPVETTPNKSLRLQVAVFAFTRVIFDASARMVYPFLDVISRGLGVSLETLAVALTARNLAGTVGPVLSPYADLKGRKVSMVAGVFLFALGIGIIAIWPSYATFFFAGCLSYLGMFIHIPAVMAYLGDSVPYQTRSRYMGLVELGWSLSFILAMPLVGFLINSWGWQTPFPFFAVLGMVSAAALIWIIPHNTPRPGGDFFRQIRRVARSPSARAALIVTSMLVMANEVVNLVFGVWVGVSFGLNITALGAASMVIGISELSGELLTVAITDRLGKERMIFAGLFFNAVFALLLPWLGQTLIGALAGLFFFYLTFEWTIVSSLPLISEILPDARASMLGANASAISLGRAAGDMLGPQIYKYGFSACAFAALLFDVIAILALRQIRLPASDTGESTPQEAG
jgi:MFS transporter, DHA1 family, inner membrane transport protein